MGLMARIWNWLTSSSFRAPRKWHPDIYPLDVDKITAELNLVEEAKRYGEARLPSTDATALAGPEALVVQRVEKARQDYMDWAFLRTQIISRDLSNRNVTYSINKALQADKEFERRAGALLTDKESLLRGLGETALRQRRELEEFKTQHGITRDARPPVFGAFLRYALLVAGIFIEAALNAHFFAQGLSTGLIGGFKFAASLAFLNITTAFVFGKVFVRQLYHKKIFKIALGALSLIVAIFFMLSIGLMIAHMRDALTEEMVDAPRVALETLIATPFGLRDVMSWVLLGISLLFASLALLDGLFSDDLYPGYGAISQRADSAIDDYEHELDGVREELEALKDEQLKTLDSEVKNTQASIAVFESLINDKRAAHFRLKNALCDADCSLQALLRKFRAENEFHRGEVPRPAYFDTMPELKPLPLPDFDTSADEVSLGEQRELVKMLLADVQALRASIQESFNRQFDQFKPLDIHFPRKETT